LGVGECEHKRKRRIYVGKNMDVVNTALAGVISIKVLEIGANAINNKKLKGVKIKKLKKIESNKWI